MKKLVTQPHIIFSTENPKYADKAVETIPHLKAIYELKKVGGGQVYSVDGSYGNPEKSIFISNPSTEQKELVRRMSFRTGQDSHIESTGNEHQMLHHHGEDAGKIKTGIGTVFHESKPNDFYSRMPDGTYFTHNFNDEFEKSKQFAPGSPELRQFQDEWAVQKPEKPKLPRAPAKRKDSVDLKSLSQEDYAKYGRVQDSTLEHEGFHHTLDQIAHKYGKDAAKQALRHVVNAHDMEALKAVGRFISDNYSYKPNDELFDEEVIAHSRDLLVSPRKRKLFEEYHGDKAKDYLNKLKAGHERAAKVARALKPEDVGVSGQKLAASEMEKGARGDWQKEGYALEHSHNSDINQHKVLVHSPNKSEVAGHFIFEKVGNDWMPTSANVKKEHQRKGIASAAYKMFEEKTGNKLVPHKDRFGQDKRSDEAKKLWEARSRNLQKNQSNQPANVNINPEHGRILANVHEQAKHQPDHPETQKTYSALINETANQYKDLLNQGYKFSPLKPGQQNPYKNSKDLHADLEQNKHMWYFPTEQGFGPKDKENMDHPLFVDSGFKDRHGNKMLHNDVFRVVHDVNGHHHGGKTNFSAKGEHQAYLAHKKMYSPEAYPALAAETVLQNSVVNFGPNAEHNKKNRSETIYAEQKAFAAPDWVVNGKWHE